METVLYTIKERTAFITINRPEKRNALNREVVESLKVYFSEAEKNEQVKTIVLKGSGNAFCSGADLKYIQDLQDFSESENLEDSNELKDLFLQIYRTSKPVIAQINGPALAGGCGLVSVCDFAFCTSESKFGYTEVRIGFIPAIVMIFLIRKIGESKSRRFLLSGEIFDCETAKKSGLVNDYFEDEEELETFVNEFTSKLNSQNSSSAMALTKSLLIKVQDLSLNEALSEAVQANATARKTEDCKKGIQAFLNKEKPRW